MTRYLLASLLVTAAATSAAAQSDEERWAQYKRCSKEYQHRQNVGGVGMIVSALTLSPKGLAAGAASQIYDASKYNCLDGLTDAQKHEVQKHAAARVRQDRDSRRMPR